ncbi:MAG: SMI1/KNR4 family protein [Streptomyces sp.]|nr:SMI1/KNR4 family protein [Streptomyces sp.]
MNSDQASAGDLAALRAAFGMDDGGESALGWEAVRAFEAEQGVVLPEPYRTFVGEPFPLTTAWLWEEDDGPYEDPEAAIRRFLDHGSVVLGTDGCAMNWHLVVSGPQRGHIWHITDVGAMPFGSEFGFTTSEPGFAGWVKHWAAGKEWFDAPSAEWGDEFAYGCQVSP